MITVLAGGVGAARLLRALGAVVEPTELTAVINVGDDLVLHGLTICPDVDTVTYTLAGLNDEARGWGLTGESWRVMDELAALGGEAWFRLGDRDLATHLYRSQRLAEGATKTEVTAEIARARGVAATLLPASDDPVATTLETLEGPMAFQEYFVRRRHEVRVTAVSVTGVATARPGPDVLGAIERAERVVVAPSNPLLSIDPILALGGVREALARRGDAVAVSPLVGGAALKGPADRLMRELGLEASAAGVAAHYGELVATWVIDEVDAGLAGRIEAAGHEVRVTTTVMDDPARARALAEAVLS